LTDPDRAGLVKDDLDPIDDPLERAVVADVTPYEFGSLVQERGWTSAWMHLFIQAVKDDDLVASLRQGVDEMRSDESCTACDENPHRSPSPGRRSSWPPDSIHPKQRA
jgi:hypothetical protein